MAAARPGGGRTVTLRPGAGAAPQTHSPAPAHLWLVLSDVPAAATDSWAPVGGRQRGSRSWKGETGGAPPAGVWRPPLLEEGQTAEALPRPGPACPPARPPPAPPLTCDMQQLQLPTLACQEQRPREACAGRGQQPGQQGRGGEAVVPLQQGHQGEALIHQVERELEAQEEDRGAVTEEWERGTGQVPLGGPLRGPMWLSG